MNEHIVKENTYIPTDISSFPEIPDQPLLEPKLIYNADFENNYPFLDRSFKARLLNFGIYLGIYTLVFPLQKIRYGLKIEGRKNITKNKKLFKNGAMTVSNHVYRWDFLAVLQAVRYRRMWFPVKAYQVNSKDRNFIRGAGGIPIPSTIGAFRHYNKAFDTLHAEKRWMHVFPESCRWDYYEPIRPFKLGAFKMAYGYKIPVIPCVISFRKPTGLRKLLGVKHPLITVSVGEPILPEQKEGLSKTENCRAMLENAHAQMVKMAGIEKNMWPAESAD